MQWNMEPGLLRRGSVDMAMMDSGFPDFCCPQCKGGLDVDPGGYSCPACNRRYPIVLGIPDFRLFPDPYIGVEDDHRKGAFLAGKADQLDFQGLVRLYWKITPEVSPDRAERFMRNSLALADRAAGHLQTIEALSDKCGRYGFQSLLEIGCGTGGFLVATKEKFAQTMGMDIAFRWLIIARKRLEESGFTVPLVCACAEHLPFRGEDFDVVVSENVLEHLRDQEEGLRESYRVLKNNGVLFLTTVNRFSMAPEPHVRVWGVGFLPRKWMPAYVRIIKGIAYGPIKLLSLFELKGILRKAGFGDHKTLLPSIGAVERRNFGTAEKACVILYEIVKRIPVIRLGLYLFVPFFEIFGRARANREHPP
jgi:ubiquinone/menaquinone biosynthesis C-methylase UbiE/uncharacterized protein YbaR (Trm112 family)